MAIGETGPNCELPFGSGTLSFWFRIGKSDEGCNRVSTLATPFSSGKYGLLDGSTYPSGRMVTHPSDVTPESKTDTNAGTTAASGCGNPVPELVIQVIQTP